MKSLPYDAYTVAMICPLEVEMSAARFMLNEEHVQLPGREQDTNQYILGELSNHNVVIASLPLGSQGTVSAATVAMHLARTFPNIKLRLLVGIAGGVPSSKNDIRLGDVVVSTPSSSFGGVVEYDMGKQTPTGFVRKGFLSPPPTEWRGAIARMKSDHRVRSNKVNEFLAEMMAKYTRLTEYGRPDSQKDILFESEYEHTAGEPTCLNCDPARIVSRPRRDLCGEPTVFYGLIASGNHVMKHAHERDRISNDCDGILCFEMEAAGLMNDFPCIVIRGISDYCDSHKNDCWQPYAAAAAAGIANELLSYLAPSNGPHVNDDLATQCLRHLFVTDPAKDKQRIESDKDKLLRDCYSWILSDSQFIAWLENDQDSLLWIRGDPGKGKTMLMIGLIHEITVLLSDPGRGILTYFFCQSNFLALNNAASILRGLIWMIVSQDRSLIRHILLEYRKYGERLFDGPNVFFALRSIFVNILDDPGLSTVYVLVDAIDECSTELDKFLQLVTNSTARLSSKVKWILTSRHRPDIPQMLGCNAFQRHIDLEENSRFVTEAVRTFISYKTDLLSQQRSYDPELKVHLERLLREKASDTFLWVALVSRELAGAESWEAETIVEELPSGLQPLYDHMVSQIENLRRSQSDVCYGVLRARSLTFRPVSLEELRSITSLPPRLARDMGSVRNMIAMCGSFLTIEKSQVNFIHQSAKDYFTAGNGQRIFEIDQVEEHRKIVLQSMRAMGETLKHDLMNLKYPGTLIADVPTSDRLGAIAYAVCFWIHHLLEYLRGSSNVQQIQELLASIHKFLQLHLLHWIETLSLLGKVSEGLIMITQLKHYLKSSMNNHLFDLLHDTNRFLLQSRAAVEQAPLQVYCSSLIFAPKQSVVRNQFKHCIPDWIRRLSHVREDWSSLIQTLEGHNDWVNDVAFSADGALVASASNDHTIRLWDVVAGSTRALLEGHTDVVKAVTYSPSGHLLASASNDCTIRLWNPNTGTVCGILLGHTNPINSVVFSPDGMFLASVSNDRTVRIWDIMTNSQRHVLLGHKNWVNDAVYSPDGTLLATVSGDWTIRLWNTESGSLHSRLKQSMGWLNSISWSPENLVVAGSSNGNIYLWDISTESLLATVKAHTKGVTKVVFSPDGQVIASASNDCTVRLWHTGQRSALAILKGHTATVKAVTFSAKENLIASASTDSTVRLWDTVNTKKSWSLNRHFNTVNAVAVSSNGELIASISVDNTVRLWDMLTMSSAIFRRPPSCERLDATWSFNVAFSLDDRQLVATWNDNPTIHKWIALCEGINDWSYNGYHAGITYPIDSVCFSPDNQVLASHSSDGVVRVWDVASGWIRATFSGHQEAVSAICFSPCSQRVACASLDGSIYVWEATTGKLYATLKGHEASVNAIAFSSNGQHIVSGSTDGTVRLWGVVAKSVQSILRCQVFPVNTVAFSDDDTLVYSTLTDGTAIIWSIAGCFTRKIRLRAGAVFSPNYQFAARIYQGHDMMLHNTRTNGVGVLIYRTQLDESGNRASIESVIFSRDSQVMALVLSDDTIQLYSTTTMRLQRTINMNQTKMDRDPTSIENRLASLNRRYGLNRRRGNRMISMVEFSPHGDLLVCVLQKSIYVWDVVTGVLHCVFLAHSDAVENISISSDSRLVASASRDGTIQIWESTTGVLLHKMVVHGSYSGDSAVFFGDGLYDRQSSGPSHGVDKAGSRGLFVSNPWITYRNDHVLWLPAEYRATCVAVHAETIVLGHSSGEVTVIEFDVDRIPACDLGTHHVDG